MKLNALAPSWQFNHIINLENDCLHRLILREYLLKQMQGQVLSQEP